jgi:hypothetical protein
LRRFCGLVGWAALVTVLTAGFGALTAPLLLMLAADVAVGVLVVRAAAEATLAIPSRG